MLIDVVDKTHIVNRAKLWQKFSNYIYLSLFQKRAEKTHEMFVEKDGVRLYNLALERERMENEAVSNSQLPTQPLPY